MVTEKVSQYKMPDEFTSLHYFMYCTSCAVVFDNPVFLLALSSASGTGTWERNQREAREREGRKTVERRKTGKR